MQIQPVSKLSPLQLELLRIYSFQPSEAEMLEIKQILGRFFANRLTFLVNKAVEEKGITEEDLENWLNDEKQ
jgi:hypothetical protein